MSYNPDTRIKEYQQIIVNIINYTLWLYEKKYISEKTMQELLKLCNPSKGSESYESRRK